MGGQRSDEEIEGQSRPGDFWSRMLDPERHSLLSSGLFRGAERGAKPRLIGRGGSEAEDRTTARRASRYEHPLPAMHDAPLRSAVLYWNPMTRCDALQLLEAMKTRLQPLVTS